MNGSQCPEPVPQVYREETFPRAGFAQKLTKAKFLRLPTFRHWRKMTKAGFPKAERPAFFYPEDYGAWAEGYPGYAKRK